MAEPVAVARARIDEVVVQLAALRDELRRLAASVPGDEEVPTLLFGIATRLSAMRFQLRGIAAALGETDAEEDEAGQLRSAIECVLADLLEPAIVNLEQAAEARRPAAET
jgi:hypothetical protein